MKRQRPRKQSHQTKRRNNDDAIASLMKEMSQQQGYNISNEDGDDNDDTISQINHHHDRYDQMLSLRLLPELSEYPNNSYCPGNTSIWNPYVQSFQPEESQRLVLHSNGRASAATTKTTLTTTLTVLPTNPQIEIIRRRCYEKFKKEAIENLSRIIIHSHAGASSSNNNSSSSSSSSAFTTLAIWKNSIPNLSTSIPSMLEKWHMDSKLYERQQLQQQYQQQRPNFDSDDDDDNDDEDQQNCNDEYSDHHTDSYDLKSSCFYDPNTSRIYHRTMQQLQQQPTHPHHQKKRDHYLYYDPILPSKSAPSLFKSIFKSEMTKAILVTTTTTTTMTNNKSMADYDNDNSNNRILLPKELHKLIDKKSRQMQKMLYKWTSEVIESYPQQLQKAVILQQQQQSSSSSARKKNKKRQQKGHNLLSSSSFKIQVSKVSRSSSTRSSNLLNNGDDYEDSHNDNANSDENNQIQLSYSGISYRVHVAYYEKLQRLYDRATIKRRIRRRNRNIIDDDDDSSSSSINVNEDHNQNSSNSSSYRTRFHEILFCLLCRYDMLQGAGLQAGVPGRVMDVLKQQFDCRFECFASPLNCRYESYCSAFDIDIMFGSVGNFFDLDFTTKGGGGGGGCYQANPPFCEELIGKMNTKIYTSLKQTAASNTATTRSITQEDEEDSEASVEEGGIPLMFIVFVPAWKQNSDSYQSLLNNPFLTHHLLLEQGKHWYTEGTQHRRDSSFRVASFDTSVLFYQNMAAKIKWPISKKQLDLLTSAFCDDPGSMEKTTTAAILTKEAIVSKKNVAPASISADTTMQSEKFSSIIEPPAKQQEKTYHHRHNSHKKKEKGKQKQMDGSGKKRKRQWMEDKDESTAQLDLLQSLGLVSSRSGDSTKKRGSEAKNKEESNSIKQIGKKNERRRKKHK